MQQNRHDVAERCILAAKRTGLQMNVVCGLLAVVVIKSVQV